MLTVSLLSRAELGRRLRGPGIHLQTGALAHHLFHKVYISPTPANT